MQKTRADFPIGTKARFKESGKEVEIISIRDYHEQKNEDAEYDGPDTVFIKMGGLLQKTKVEKLEHA